MTLLIAHADETYKDLLVKILDHGIDKSDRTGVGTRSLFGHQCRFDLRSSFPLLTTKKMWWKGISQELFWILSGSTNVKDLQARGVSIWDEWATKEQCAKYGREEGDLGPVYGHQWRNFGASQLPPYFTDEDGVTHKVGPRFARDGYDQITMLVNQLRNSPNSRRMIVTGWNPFDADQVALPPCHTLFQFYVANGELSCQLYQRSADVFLGVPFNIASYALLTTLLAHVAGLKPGEFVHTFGDVHIYRNHFEQVELQLKREPRPSPLVSLVPGTPQDIDLITPDHVLLEGYDPHPAIKAEVAV